MVRAVSGKTTACNDAPAADTPPRAIRLWLYAVAALMFATLVVGGATRLTESGLSIVEWKPVTGALPPLSARRPGRPSSTSTRPIPQYRELNRGMTLDEFKTIYLVGVGAPPAGAAGRRGVPAAVPVVPLARLDRAGLARAAVDDLRRSARCRARSAGGWWRRASPTGSSVSQYRLAFHLTLACVIYRGDPLDRAAAAAARVDRRRRARIRATRDRLARRLCCCRSISARWSPGLRAGLVYNTWPLIDGAFIPDAARLLFEKPAWRNFFENTLTVQFDHRMVAYALWFCRTAARARCRSYGARRAGLTMALALAAAHPSGRARHRDAAPSGADAARAAASGRRDRRAGDFRRHVAGIAAKPTTIAIHASAPSR